MRMLAVPVMLLLLCSCQSSPDEVMNKVLVDFGLREKPEGYVSGSDMVFKRLDAVGSAEIKRMNLAEQHGAVKFQQDGGLRGKYYKEVKVYERYFPKDVQAVSRSSVGETGYVGYLDYEYRMYQSPRVDTSAEAAAATADVPTDVTGRDTYRYTFSGGGEWNAAKGEKVRK